MIPNLRPLAARRKKSSRAGKAGAINTGDTAIVRSLRTGWVLQGRALMPSIRKGREHRELPASQDSSGDSAERRRLRWQGMQREADELHLTLRRVPHTDCVIVVPLQT